MSIFEFLMVLVSIIIALALSRNRILHAILVPVFLESLLWDILAMSFEIS